MTPTAKRILDRILELSAGDATKPRLSLDLHRVIEAVGEELEGMEKRVRCELASQKGPLGSIMAADPKKKRGRGRK